jgi:hypothetical protein
MGNSEEGEAGMNFSSAGEHEGDDSVKGPGGQGVEGCEEGVDSEEGSSEAVQRSGERRSSFVSSSLLSSSASFCHFLVFFAGGDVTSGDAEAGGGVGGDGAGDGVQAFPLIGVATAGPRVAPVWAVTIEEGWRARLVPSVQTAQPCRRRRWRQRRCLTVVATTAVVEIGRLQVTVMT